MFFSAWSDGEGKDGAKATEGKEEQNEESSWYEKSQSRNWEEVIGHLLPKMLLVVLQ
jgi:hypothetical protein